VSEYVRSLASNAQQSVYVYHVVTDNAEACMCFWDYFFSTEKLSCREDIIRMAYESEHWLAVPSGRISLQLDDGEQPQSERARPLESAVEALNELKLKESYSESYSEEQWSYLKLQFFIFWCKNQLSQQTYFALLICPLNCQFLPTWDE
jgi:hypothetical protein